jgi:hypothetical protein
LMEGNSRRGFRQEFRCQDAEELWHFGIIDVPSVPCS